MSLSVLLYCPEGTELLVYDFFDTIFVILWRFLKSTDQKRSINVNNGQKYQRSCLQMLPLKDNLVKIPKLSNDLHYSF